MGMTVLNLQMYSVALPAIRDNFGIGADTVALSVTAYMLPFVIFMPLYGQLGDGLGKRRLFSIGIIVFSIGHNRLPTIRIIPDTADRACAARHWHCGRQPAMHCHHH